ncbi:hypothetical protein D3C71_867130 [compost metagenome]
MVGEGAIHIAVQRNDLGPDGFQQRLGQFAGHAVAGIGHHLERAVQLHVVGDALDVIGIDLALLQAARFGGHVQLAVADALEQFGDGIARERFAAHHDLEAVVVRRVVAAGNGHAAARAQVVAGEVHHRGRRQADVDDIAAGAAQAFDQPGAEFRAGQTTIAAHHDLAQPLHLQHRADGLADQRSHLRGELAADHAADIVGAENIGRHVLARHAGHGRRTAFADGWQHGQRRLFQAFAQGRAVFHLGGVGRPSARQRHLALAELQHQRDGHQQCRHHRARDSAQAQRARLHIRHGRRQAQPALADRTGQGLGTATERTGALLDHVVVALAQRQVARLGHADRIEGGREAQQRLAHIHQRRPLGAQLHRCRQAQALAAGIADHAGDHGVFGVGRFQKGQARVAKGLGVGIGRLQRGRQHLHLLGARPALADGHGSGLGIAAGQRGGDPLALDQLAQLRHLAIQRGLHPGHDLVTRLLQRRPDRRLPPLADRTPAEPQPQQQQRAHQQRAGALACQSRLSFRLCLAHGSSPCQRTPVWPNPPVPLALSVKVSTTCRPTRAIGSTTSCAMRSPGCSVKASRPRFHALISSGPW